MNGNHMNILSVFYSYPIDIFFVFVVRDYFVRGELFGFR